MVLNAKKENEKETNVCELILKFAFAWIGWCDGKASGKRRAIRMCKVLGNAIHTIWPVRLRSFGFVGPGHAREQAGGSYNRDNAARGIGA